MVLVVNCYNPVSELVGLVHGFKHFYWRFFTQLYMLSVSSSGPQTGKKDMDTESNWQTLYEVLCENTSAMKAKHYVSSGDVWKTYCICHHPLRPIKTKTVKVITWGKNVTSHILIACPSSQPCPFPKPQSCLPGIQL